MRELNVLHPTLQKKLKKMLKKCGKKGLYIGFSSTHRGKAEQDSLYAQGRTKPGSIVTNVKYPYSNHNWYIAADFYRADGKGAYDDSDGFFAKVGAVAKSVGLEWGGDWTGFVDKPHIQLKKWGSTPAKLIRKYGTPDKYKAKWKRKLARYNKLHKW